MYHSIVLKSELEIGSFCLIINIVTGAALSPNVGRGKNNDYVISLFFYFGALCIGGIMSVHFAKQDQRVETYKMLFLWTRIEKYGNKYQIF